MSAQVSLPIYAHLGGREFPVRWAWYRPEPQVGDTVRLPVAPSGTDDWRSFRVVAKRIREAAPTRPMIDLDVEPLVLQD